MCGINLIVADAHHEQIDNMNKSIDHRGPDDSGSFHHKRVTLGSTRLKIIDLHQGSMPFHSKCGRYHLVYNGEIYNYKELKEQVEDYPFTSTTDTEVLFAFLQKYGEEAIMKLNGMFSFAFYDQQEEKVLVARDRLGIKPLFYAQTQKGIFISSEIKPLLAIPEIDTSLDRDALYHYLSLLSVPQPHTIYRGIRRFPAANYAWIENQSLEPKPYWNLDFRPKNHQPEETLAEEIRHLFLDSVKKRLVADVPLGVFLSGGIDSNVVTGAAQEINSSPLKTFCMGFESGGDERELAGASASAFGTDHRDFLLRPDELWKEIPDIVTHFSEPFAGGLPMWFLSREIAKHVTVALSGTGGDEIFGNYGRVQHLRPGRGMLRGAISNLKISGLKGLLDLGGEQGAYIREHGAYAGHYYHEKCYALKEYEKRTLLVSDSTSRTDMLLNTSFWNQRGLDLEDRLFQMDLEHQLRDEFLFSQDILSMAHHLEVRVPFLDHRLVEKLAQVPSSIRSQVEDPKVWMRKVFGEFIPEHVLNKKKSGFMIPYGEWMRTHLRPMAEDLFEESRIRSQGYFEHAELQSIWKRHLEGEDMSYKLWPILVFQIWLG